MTMPALPTEVLQSICEHSGELVTGWPSPPSFELNAATSPNTLELRYSSLLAFSRSSQHFRSISAPYLFRRFRVRTVEEAMLVAGSALLKHAVHLYLPAVDLLTARRPVPPRILSLVATVKSIRISSTAPSFFYASCTPLTRLLSAARALDTLELDCGPILESVDTMPILAGLIPALPSRLSTLRVSMPGGQPEYAGTETLLKALSQPHRLPNLNNLCLSMHMSPVITATPEKLAIALARRNSSIRRITFVAPGRNPQRGSPVWDLVGPQTGMEAFGGFKQRVMGWEFRRGTDDEGGEVQSLSELYSVNTGVQSLEDTSN